MSQILTLAAYKERRGITASVNDKALTPALLSAEDAVEQYTGRDFTKAQEAEIREYTWDYATVLDTDDFTELVSIRVDTGANLAATEYDVGPREGPTYFWIDFSRYWQAPSFSAGQMGFTRNLDQWWSYDSARHNAFTTVTINATWGWPGGAPASVEQAVVELVDVFARSQGTSGDLQSEAIADVSYVFQRQSEDGSSLPARVAQLLEPFRRLTVG